MIGQVLRSDVYWVDLDPVRGWELAKTRPCVIVSASELNAVRRTVVIVPLTTTKSPATWPLLIDMPSQGTESKARIEQIRVIDKSRLKKRIDKVSLVDMSQLESALGLLLNIGTP